MWNDFTDLGEKRSSSIFEMSKHLRSSDVRVYEERTSQQHPKRNAKMKNMPYVLSNGSAGVAQRLGRYFVMAWPTLRNSPAGSG